MPMYVLKRQTAYALIAAVLLLVSSAGTLADHHSLEDKIKAALADERRSAADVARDRNRRPLETLTFFRLKDDMQVLELLPGGGWYTSILGPVLEAKGKLYIAIGAEGIGAAIAGKPGFGSTEVISFDGQNLFKRNEGDRRFTPPDIDFGLNRKLDLALTFRNMHNFTEDGRANVNKAVLTSLKRGGLYGVIDHTRRHMQGDSDEVWRRMDPVQMIKELESVGFEFVDYAKLHYRVDDALRFEVGQKSVTGNTDRFTLLFKKP